MKVEKRRQQLRGRAVVVGLIAILLAIMFLGGMIVGSKEDKQSVTESATESVKETEFAPVQTVIPEEDTYYCVWMDEEISQSDFELICKTTHLEGRRQSEEARYMIALTILNRYASGFEETFHEVIYDAYDATEMDEFETCEWNEQTEECVLRALKENTHPYDLYYFRTKHYHTFGHPYMQSGTLYFSTEEEK